MRSLLLIAAISVAAYSQPIAGAGSISGTVFESSDSTPVRKAIVTLTLQGTPRTWAAVRTDDSGKFQFDKLPAGKYDLRASKNRDGSAASPSISLAEGETRDGLKLHFVHPGTIAGRVVDPEGDPLPGVSLTVLRASRTAEGRSIEDYASTDDRGEFRIIDLSAGRYYLRANPTGAHNVSEAFGTQYYGGTEEWTDAAVVTMHDGDNLTGLDFHLTVARISPVRGRVTGVASGAPVEISVSPAPDGSATRGYGATATAPEYKFDFGKIEGGKYVVQAKLSEGGKKWADQKEIDSRHPLDDLVLAPVAAIDVKGQLRVEGASPPLANLQLTLSRTIWATESIDGHPDASGKFIIQQVPPGEWALSLGSFPAGAFVKSVLLGDKDILFSRIPIEPGSEALLTVVVSMNSAKVQGTASAGAGILLAPMGRFHAVTALYYGAVADADGKFHMENLAPGKYKIFSLEKLSPSDFRNPEAADRLGASGEEIELAEGATIEAHPKLIPNEKAREALQ